MLDDLIKRVAERLGAKQLPGNIWNWQTSRGRECFAKDTEWLTSVDAALSVVKDFPIVMMTKTVKNNSCELVEVLSEAKGIRRFRAEAESLPRAILLAFLEAPHD